MVFVVPTTFRVLHIRHYPFLQITPLSLYALSTNPTTTTSPQQTPASGHFIRADDVAAIEDLQDTDRRRMLNYMNDAFSALFFLEMLLKVGGWVVEGEEEVRLQGSHRSNKANDRTARAFVCFR